MMKSLAVGFVLASVLAASLVAQQQAPPQAQQRTAPPAQQGDQRLAQLQAQLDRANRDIGEMYSQMRELQAAIADGRLVDAARARQAFIAEFEKANELKVDPATLKVQQPAKDAQSKKE